MADKPSSNIFDDENIDFMDRFPSLSEKFNLLVDDIKSAEATFDYLDKGIDTLYLQLLRISSQVLNIETELSKHTKFCNPNIMSDKDKVEAKIACLSNKEIKENTMNKETDSKGKTSSSKLSNRQCRIVRNKKMQKLKDAVNQLKKDRPASTIIKATELIPFSKCRDPPKLKGPAVKSYGKSKTHEPKTQTLGLVGLVNIYNTCYMNSAMQCVRHLPSIKSYFLSDKFESEITGDDPSLIYEIARLIKKLSLSTDTAVVPARFYTKVVSLNPKFKLGNHEDSNEFIMFVFNRIMEDTATPIPKNGNGKAELQALYEHFQYKMSYFVETFYHQIRTDSVCSGCAKRCVNYDYGNVLIMSLPEEGSCSIEKLFEEFMHAYDNSNSICKDCDKKINITKVFSYQPKVVIILLKRYTYSKGYPEKKTIPCDFPLDNFRIGRAVYKLWAISLHQGDMSVGHYTAVCLNSDDGIWYEFNNEIVRPVDITDTLIKEESYMLFYESEDGSEHGFSTA